MTQWMFLAVKYAIETAALCFLLSYSITKDPFQSFGSIVRRCYLFPISGLLQELVYLKLGSSLFSILYVLWNLRVLWLYWRLEVRREPRFASVWISFSLIHFQICQLFVTYLIFALPNLAKYVTSFGPLEILVSTLFIWTVGFLSAVISCSNLPDMDSTTIRETAWPHIFLWVIFAAEQVLVHIFTLDQMANGLSVVVLALLYVDVLLYYLSFMQSVKERNGKIEQIQIQQQYMVQLQHYQDINTLYKKLREMRHDANNQILYVEQMLREKQYDSLEEYFTQVKETLSPAMEMADYGNELINAILWSKCEIAKREGLFMEIQVMVPPSIPVKGYHICSLLGNLIDNAIEGSRGVKAPRIHITIQMKQSYLYCCVRNRVDRDVLRDNPNLFTTKEDASNHGFGIWTVKKIVEKYHGMVDFSVREGEFLATAMLLCQKGKD